MALKIGDVFPLTFTLKSGYQVIAPFLPKYDGQIIEIEKDENRNMCSWCTFTPCSFHYLSQNNSKYPIQAIFLVYDFSAAPLLFKIGTFSVPTEVESGFGILSQNLPATTR